MTIVVALKDEKNNKIYLGADKQGTAGDISLNFGCKLLEVEIPLSNGKSDSIYMGFSGSHFLHSYLWNVFEPPQYDGNNFIQYLYCDFFMELKKELIDQNLLVKENDVVDSESDILIVHNGHIYNVYDDLSIVESPRPYAVAGSGFKFAVSILENNLIFHSNMDYKKIVEECLYTTGKLNIYCNIDYDILTIEY